MGPGPKGPGSNGAGAECGLGPMGAGPNGLWAKEAWALGVWAHGAEARLAQQGPIGPQKLYKHICCHDAPAWRANVCTPRGGLLKHFGVFSAHKR